MIRIRRKTHQPIDMWRSYEVIVDGNVVGRINPGEVFEYNVSPGAHALQLKIDWCGSPILHFKIEDREVVDFECGGLSGYKVLLALPISTLLRNRYLWLKQIGTHNIFEFPSLHKAGSRVSNPLQAGKKWMFVFRYGVLGWGIATGILYQIFRLIEGVKLSPMDWGITLVLFMIGGLCWGLIMWTVFRKREHT